jgi:ribosomal-protein-alanine N-acetyltransferase
VVGRPGRPGAVRRVPGQDPPADHAGYLICDRDSGAIAGYVNISGILMGVLRGGYLGYAAFLAYSGTGHASAGIGLVVAHAFDALGLHRLEANIQPGNEPSRRIARKLGFRLEGYSPEYLFVDGAWRDRRVSARVAAPRGAGRRGVRSAPACARRAAAAGA